MDWNTTRLDTPSCQKMIHFNNAGSSLMPDPVINEVLDYIKRENEIGGYELMFQESARFTQVYESIAELINAGSDEIALFENATRAFQALIYGLNFKPGDIILTSSSEYISNYLSFLHLKKTKGVQIIHLKEDEHGQTSIEDFKQKCKELKNIKLVSLCHIPTQSGLINLAKEFGEVARDEGIFYFLDTTQSVGHLHIDVEEIGCDAIVGTGRKYLRGPRGTGFLYVKKSKQSGIDNYIVDNLSAVLVDSNNYKEVDDLKGKETWEKNYALIVGLGKACEYALKIGTKNIESRCLELGSQFREKLSRIPNVKVQDPGLHQSALVTFSVENYSSEFLCEKLFENKANTTWVPEARALLDFKPRGISDVVRASLHYFNSADEIDKFIDLLKSLIKK